jgi:formamidopyrimidine-DNA glycosylase
MPELPEVETIGRQLRARLAGRQIRTTTSSTA